MDFYNAYTFYILWTKLMMVRHGFKTSLLKYLCEVFHVLPFCFSQMVCVNISFVHYWKISTKNPHIICIKLNQNVTGKCLDDIWDNLRTFSCSGMGSEMRKTFVHFCYMIRILDLLTAWLHPIVGGRITVNKTITILIFNL